MSPLCDMTVTCYRRGKRQVLKGCFFSGRYTGLEDIRGTRLQGKFTLIAPAQLRIGDRVLPGIGPETVPTEAETIRWVQPMYLEGNPHHWEAGN